MIQILITLFVWCEYTYLLHWNQYSAQHSIINVTVFHNNNYLQIELEIELAALLKNNMINAF